MIAVVGRLDGATLAIARRAVRAGAAAELVATIPPGPAGDRALLDVAAAGIGHAAALRSPATSLEPADLELALRYLPDVRVVVVAMDAQALGAVAGSSAAWAGARLVVVAAEGADRLPGDAIVLAPPASDPDEAFAGTVAALAARLDGGEEPTSAWAAVTRDLGLESRRA